MNVAAAADAGDVAAAPLQALGLVVLPGDEAGPLLAAAAVATSAQLGAWRLIGWGVT
jgi:hypothetical protein